MHSSHKTLPLIGLTAMLCAAAFQPDLTPRAYLAATYAGGLPSATSTTATSYPLGPTGSTVVRVTAVATDPFGNVYLSSSLNCVFKVDAAGNLTRVADTCRPGYSGDGGPALAAQLNAPQGLAADAAGNLYIADRNNHRIRKVSSTGTITTIAGDGSAGFSGDGGAAASAQLNAPRGVALDPSGNLYIADQNNHRIRAVSPAGIVTTVAGDGTAGFSGDGGPAAGAQLNSPQGVAADSSGNLYIADGGNNRIRKVSNGTIGTVAGGGGPAAGAELSHPQGVAVGASGNLYIADTGNHRIREVAGGTIATIAGSTPGFSGDGGAAAGAQLHAPEGVAVDSSGNVYVADSANNRVRKLAPGGTISTIAGNGAALFSGDDGPAIAAQLSGPWGITLDPGGNLYFADRYNHRIRKIAPGGAITTAYGGSAGVLAEPAGLASDAVGNLYIGDAGNARVLKVGPGCAPCVVAGIAGSPGYSGDNGPATSARIYSPNALAVDSAGNVYIADSGRLRGARVRKVSPNGIVTTIAGTGAPGHSGDGGPATSAQIASALGLALDSAGNLYIADPDSSTVRKVASDGTIATVAGQSYSRGNSGDGGPARSALLAAPQGLAIDSAGNLFIADGGNGNVRMVSPDGAIQTIAGTGTPGYSGDGGPATGAQLGSLQSLALDAAGNVYISDSANNAIRMLQPAGTQPLLSVAAAHNGRFRPGQNGAAYTVTVSNAPLALPPSGTVTVTGALPAGLTATAIGGTGWNCTVATLTCTRSDSLASYPTVTVTVNVAPDAPTQVSNVVTVSGGGSIAANAMDVIDMDVIDMGAIDSPRGRIAETHPPAAIDGSKGGARPSTSVPLQITTTVVPGVTQYQSYYKALSATGGTPPYTWSAPRTQYNVSLPEGMSLDPNTGVISATQVNGQGGYEVTIEVTDSAAPTPAAATQILDFGVESDTSFAGCQMFPPDSIYNQRIGQLPLDLNPNHQIPAGYLTFPIHPDFGHGYYPSPGGIPWMRVPANQPLSNVSLAYDGQIDPAGVYQWPLPPWPSAVVEGTSYGGDGSDHHILILQSSTNDIIGPQSGACTLYETYQDSDVPSMYDAGSNTWSFAAGAHYNLNGNQIAASTGTLDSGAQDSAGIPMAPLLLRYSEVPLGAQHPLRIAFPNPTNWYVWPGAGCCAGSGPPQGLLYRLKAGVNWQAACPVSVYPQAATVLQALQQYGAYMSDHGGTGYVGGVPDPRWDDDDLACIKTFHVSDLEVVDNSPLEVSSISGQTRPYVVPAALPAFVVGASYNATISTAGGNPASLAWSISSGSLPPGLLLVAGTIGGTPTSSAGSPYIFGITVTDTVSGYSSAEQQFALGITVSSLPDLTVVASHTGNFTQGQTGVTYTVDAINTGTAPTSGTVTVVDNLPAGMTATAMAGAGWNCTLATLTCTRGDALAAGGSYPLSLTVNIGYTPPYNVTNSATVSGGAEINRANDQSSDLTIVSQLPDLTVSSTHNGNFTQGQTGATYTITVADRFNVPPTTGAVTVVDVLPPGLTATAIGGAGWTCTLGTLTCTRGDSLAGGGSYPLTLTVNVAGDAGASLTNSVTVSGGGEGNTANDMATDPTIIVQLPDLTAGSSHTGNFRQGQTGAVYTITAANIGGSPTSGTVTLVDSLPTGLTATAIGGTGWSCTLATLTCTRSDALAAGGSYPLTLTVTVAGNAAASVTNGVTVSGGGESNTANDTAADLTTIVQVSPCDVNADGNFSVLDVQMTLNEVLGVLAPVHDPNGDGVVNVADVQLVINAVLGRGCPAD